MKKEMEKQMKKLNKMLEETDEVNSKVEDLREKFKSEEFQHRVEVGEIQESLQNFQSKEYRNEVR